MLETIHVVEDPSQPSCHTCGAVIPATLTAFHQAWHDDQVRKAPRFFEGPKATHVDRQLMVVAALKAVPHVTARPVFVVELRERLMTEAREFGGVKVQRSR